LLVCARRIEGQLHSSFALAEPSGPCRELFWTRLSLRAEFVGVRNHVFVAGGTLGGEWRGGWLVDPSSPPPYRSVVRALPLGRPTFARPGNVIFGTYLNGKAALVAASEQSATGSVLRDGEAPRHLTASPDGRHVAWARPREGRGLLSVWETSQLCTTEE
jgi:hypothetical protein